MIEEECTGNGALAASLRDAADACLIPESTNDQLTAAHPGVIWFRVAIEGRSAHAGWAWQGVNAIVKAVPVINALAQLNDDLNLQVHPLWADQHHPINLNIGVIQGGDWPSTVPGACELRCRTSFFPGTAVEEMQGKIEEAVHAAAQTDEWLCEHPPVISYDGFRTNGVILDQNEPLVHDDALNVHRSHGRNNGGQGRDGSHGPALLQLPGHPRHLLRRMWGRGPRRRRVARSHFTPGSRQGDGQFHPRLVRSWVVGFGFWVLGFRFSGFNDRVTEL